MVTQKARTRDAGFTLIELMVVIIILGVLATIAVLSLTSANRTSQVSACKTDFKSVAAALSTYRNDRVDDLTNLSLGYPLAAGETAPSGSSLISLGYMVPLIENGSYRIYLTSGASAVGVQTRSGGSWAPVSAPTNTDADCNAIAFSGQN